MTMNYAWTSIQAEDGDQDGDWIKRDKISMEDETTSMHFLALFGYGYIFLLTYLENTFSQIKKKSQTQSAMH